MALLFMDGFEHYATADLTSKGKWTSASGAVIAPLRGRFRTKALDCRTADSSVMKIVPAAGNVAIIGFAARFKAVSRPSILFALGNEDEWLVNLHLNENGSLGVGFGGTPGSDPLADAGTVVATTTIFKVGPSSGTIRLEDGGGDVHLEDDSGDFILERSTVEVVALYYHIELGTALDDVNGTVELRINNKIRAKLSGLNTPTGAWDRILFVNPADGATPFDLDTVYVLDGTGSPPGNTFLGDSQIHTRMPSGVGASSAWEPTGASSNWQAVSETPPDDDTSFNATPTPFSTDTFQVADVPVVGSVLAGVQVNLTARSTPGAVPCSIAAITYPGYWLDWGPTGWIRGPHVLTTSYKNYATPRTRNPVTDAAWTEAEFNAMEFGYQRID